MSDRDRNQEQNGLTETGSGDPFVRRLGMGLLLFVLFLVVWTFCLTGAISLDRSLHRPDFPGVLPGIELAVVPLAAFAAARWRFATDRLNLLSASGVGPYLPFLMATTLVGLIAYLVWSWVTPLTTVGPASEFGLVRWLGTVLAAAFTCIWSPLFPRVTVTLAGMIGGTALFAALGYALFPSEMPVANDRWGVDGAHGAVFFASFVTLFWIAGAVWLTNRDRHGEAARVGPRPRNHAIWIGLVMFCTTALAL